MLCFLQKFKLRVLNLFQNRNKLKKIVFLPAAIIARSRDFGSMKDSGGKYSNKNIFDVKFY